MAGANKALDGHAAEMVNILRPRYWDSSLENYLELRNERNVEMLRQGTASFL